MEFIEMETKEDILAVAALERAIAPEVMGDAAQSYLRGIEHTDRFESEACVDYHLIYRGGAVGFFALKAEGERVTVTKLAVLPEYRRRGICRRAIGFIRETYDPLCLCVLAPTDVPALTALGFSRQNGYYEKRYD